jgi:hypothetical protein
MHLQTDGKDRQCGHGPREAVGYHCLIHRQEQYDGPHYDDVGVPDLAGVKDRPRFGGLRQTGHDPT